MVLSRWKSQQQQRNTKKITETNFTIEKRNKTSYFQTLCNKIDCIEHKSIVSFKQYHFQCDSIKILLHDIS